ncbi:hypothetical protein Barb4_00539 [Bacteroidales bacterium Barb4]|nr:hypothetical protein Barb4_00539 [Bacteroidales bacterium Barb4]
MEKFFTGKYLYGDDFSENQIVQWFNEEEEAYADLYGKNVKQMTYNAHDLNILYGYKYLNNCDCFNKVLGLGSSWGYEFLPIIKKINELTIVEASSQTVSTRLGNIIPIYEKPQIDGRLKFSDNTFDLITCFATLHHIPNVSFVLSELFRVLKPGGYMLLNEPINSMGDWRDKRLRLTKNERGIPDEYLSLIIKKSPIEVVQKHYHSCMTSFFRRCFNQTRFFDTKIYLFIDKYLSMLMRFNIHYHPKNKLQRISPASLFYVLRKQ